MSFWVGVSKAVDDISAKKEREAEAAERKAERDEDRSYRDKMFEYSKGRDSVADRRADETLQLAKDKAGFQRITDVTSGMSFGGGGGSGKTPSGSGSKEGTTSAEHAVQAAIAAGASKEALVPLIGHDISATAITELTGEYIKYKGKAKQGPGEVMSFDDFIAETNLTLTPEQEVTDEMIAEAAKAAGRGLDEVIGGRSVSDIIREQLTKKATAQYSLDLPVYVSPMDQTEVSKATEMAAGSIEDVLNDKIATLEEQYERAQDDDNEGLMKSIATKITKAARDKEALKDGRGMSTLTAEYGANAILPVLMNTPGALGVNKFGSGWDKAIASRTYTDPLDIVREYRAGNINGGDYYVIGKDIFIADGDALEEAGLGPASGSTRPQARPENLGKKVGTLPDAYTPEGPETATPTGLGEMPSGGSSGGVDLTGINDRNEVAELVSRMKVGDSITRNGKTIRLTQEQKDQLTGGITRDPLAVEPSTGPNSPLTYDGLDVSPPPGSGPRTEEDIVREYGKEFGEEKAEKLAEGVRYVLSSTAESLVGDVPDLAEFLARGSAGGAAYAASALNIGAGTIAEFLGFDGAYQFGRAGKFKEFAENIVNKDMTFEEAVAAVSSTVAEGLNEASAPGKKAPTFEEIQSGATPEGALVKESVYSMVADIFDLSDTSFSENPESMSYKPRVETSLKVPGGEERVNREVEASPSVQLDRPATGLKEGVTRLAEMMVDPDVDQDVLDSTLDKLDNQYGLAVVQKELDRIMNGEEAGAEDDVLRLAELITSDPSSSEVDAMVEALSKKYGEDELSAKLNDILGG